MGKVRKPTNGDLVAFPTPIGPGVENLGISKRELLAAMAMQGMLAHPRLMENIGRSVDGDTAEAMRIVSDGAVKHADALLAELAKELNDDPT